MAASLEMGTVPSMLAAMKTAGRSLVWLAVSGPISEEKEFAPAGGFGQGLGAGEGGVGPGHIQKRRVQLGGAVISGQRRGSRGSRRGFGEAGVV